MSSSNTSTSTLDPMSAPAPAPETWIPIPDATLICIAIFGGLVGFLALVSLPRAVGRILSSKRGGELGQGWWFGDRGKRGSPVQQYTTGLDPAVRNSGPPIHIRSASQLMPWWSMLGKRIPYTRGYTLGRMIPLVLYAAIVGVAIGWENPVTEPKHVGQLVALQLPVAVLFAVPMSPLSTLLGLDYKKLNYFHRFIGRMIFAAATIHVVLFTKKFVDGGHYFETVKNRKFIAGYTAWGAVALMMLTSLAPVRKRMFGLFRICHFLGLVILVVALLFHMPRTALMGTIALSIYGADILLRIVVKTKIKTAFLNPLPQAKAVQITIPNITSGWRAGQYVYIRIPALRRMGGMTCLENHPFTIASSDGGQMVLIVKSTGDWTRALFDLALEGSSNMEKHDGDGNRCKMILEGPYGGPGPIMHHSHSGLVLIVGGSGITYGLVMLEDAIHKAAEGRSNTKSISLTWIIKSYDEARAILPHLRSLLSLAEQTNIDAHVHLYCTRSMSVTSPTGGVEIHHGRPLLSACVDAGVERVRGQISAVKPRGVFIGVCGPQSLVQDTGTAVRSLSSGLKRRVGGIEFEIQSFTV